jgi:hypothetical protein
MARMAATRRDARVGPMLIENSRGGPLLKVAPDVAPALGVGRNTLLGGPESTPSPRTGVDRGGVAAPLRRWQRGRPAEDFDTGLLRRPNQYVKWPGQAMQKVMQKQ